MHINYEFKARCTDINRMENILLKRNPLFIGVDHQTDTYFNVQTGRLKLREGTIENALIHYERTDVAGAKQSNVLLYQHAPHPALKQILIAALSVKVIVAKKRKIYFIDNIKFHFDQVEGLGTFIEVEAIDKEATMSLPTLQQQCAEYISLFEVSSNDFVAESYSDLLLAKKSSIEQNVS